MTNQYYKKLQRTIRTRKRLNNLIQRPRLSVFRSNKYIYAQIIDDSQSQTLVAASNQKNKAPAKEVGEKIAEKALQKGIKAVVFDRGRFMYHGNIKNLANGAREKGLEF